MNALTPIQMRMVDKLRDALRRAGSTHTVQDLIDLARAGKAQFWERGGTLVVTEVVEFPRRKVLRFWVAGGDLDDVERLMPQIEQWGREQGATMAEAIGRRGWARRSEAHGYNAVATVFQKELLS
jgi:hypothetical protein